MRDIKISSTYIFLKGINFYFIFLTRNMSDSRTCLLYWYGIMPYYKLKEQIAKSILITYLHKLQKTIHIISLNQINSNTKHH